MVTGLGKYLGSGSELRLELQVHLGVAYCNLGPSDHRIWEDPKLQYRFPYFRDNLSLKAASRVREPMGTHCNSTKLMKYNC